VFPPRLSGGMSLQLYRIAIPGYPLTLKIFHFRGIFLHCPGVVVVHTRTLITGGVPLPLSERFHSYDNAVQNTNNILEMNKLKKLTDAEKQQLKDDLRPIFQKLQAEARENVLRSTIVNQFAPGYDSEEHLKESKYFVNQDSEYSSFTKFLRDVRSADTPGGVESEELRSYALATQKDMSEGSLAGGGYAVPTQAADIILEKALERSIVRPRATVLPMSSNRLEIPADVDSDHSSDYFGGITIYRPGEAGQKTATNPTLQGINLQLKKLTGLVHVSDELLEDAPALEAWLIRKFSQAIAFVEDYDFLNGDGSNAPLGALNSANPCRISVTKETSQAADSIVAENIINMWSRLWPDGQSNSVFIANIDTFPQLATMSVAVGTGGVPVYMPANQLAGKPYRELMGQPLFFTEKVPTLGDEADIALCDFSQYVVGDRGGGSPQIASSIHLKFDYDQTSFRFVLRYDGQPTWTAPLTPKVSSTTLSPFVVLGERS
jgi:HK97 family phage major capsid protein